MSDCHMDDIYRRVDLKPFRELMPTLDVLIANKTIHWHGNQICLTTIPTAEDDYTLGTGSLVYDWDRKVEETDSSQGYRLSIPEKKNGASETDFTTLCKQFRNTVFEDVYVYLCDRYKIGRLRLMQLPPKACLTWHVDWSPRLHYPMKTTAACMMVVEDKVKHLEQDTWYEVDTTRPHTVFNGSLESRIHLVGVMLPD